MQFRRSAHPRSSVTGAAAVAAAVIGGVLGASPASATAPAPSTAPADAAHRKEGEAVRDAREAVAALRPRPQSAKPLGDGVRLSGRTVTVVTAPDADRFALETVRTALRSAGAREVTTVAPGPVPPGPGPLVYVGGPAAEAALRSLKAPSPGGLPPGGYVLASGRYGNGGDAGVIAVAAADAEGMFNAAQTLRQLAGTAPGASTAGTVFPGAAVRDWPAAPVRGIVEGFYGEPWSQRDRLAQIDFLGRTKQNRYLYAPGGDPYRQGRWREEYPKAQRDGLRALAARAARNHVVLGWAVAPGQSLCFSSGEDVAALSAKLESLWRLGVRAFQLQFQDVSYEEWHCRADRAAFGTGPGAAAKAQAEVVNEVARGLRERHPDAPALSVMPTEFYQDGATGYRTALADALDPAVEVAWSGVGVVPPVITGRQLGAASEAFGHRMVTMDNYPVNDSDDDRVFLGPYTGRDPAVASASSELLVNAMRQPVASRIALFTAADFAWNPRGYDPASSWRAALDDLAGGDPEAREALGVLAGNSASSALEESESAYLVPLLREFWKAFDAEKQSGLPAAAGRLRAAFDAMALAPGRLTGVADGALHRELRPWLGRLARYGQAGRAAVDMLSAQRRGDGERAWAAQLTVQETRRELKRSGAVVGKGVLGPFLDRALASAGSWTGVRPEGPEAMSTLGAARDSDPAQMLDGKPATFYWTDAPPQPGDTIGVHLGPARRVDEIRIEMGGPGAAHDDYLRDAVLEYSAGDGGGWRRIREYHGVRTITARLAEGTEAREVRLRATKPGTTKVAVRSFTVTGPDTVRPAVSGGPAPLPGSPLGAAADGDPATAYRAAASPSADGSSGPGALMVRFGTTRPLDKVTVLTDPAVRSEAVVEAHVPGRGWRTLGDLRTGWTELPGRSLRADAVRLAWADGTPAPVVHEVVPWFADTPAARLDLHRPAVDVEIGGAPATVDAELEATRADASRGEVAAEPPKGLKADVPDGVILRRGGKLTVPVKVTVPKGTEPGRYSVPVRVDVGGGTIEQRVEVRAYPRTGGPDLALGAAASSSGDETPDFPASAVTDGAPETRWSSPLQDDAWVQVDLPEPVRIGKVVLTWQDAYASGYRVETSPDGEHWNPAAAVLDGRGGREEVRMDAPDTRHIRVRGTQRGTKYGYSLFSVEAYAVKD